MTQIDFFSNAPNRLDYVIRLLKKIQTAQQNAVVYGETLTINALSDALWQQNGFWAHDVHHSDTAEVLCAPIILLSQMPQALLPHHDIIVNLSDVVPDAFATFKRLIEVVPNEEIPRQAARERWVFYKERGYVMKHHDIARK